MVVPWPIRLADREADIGRSHHRAIAEIDRRCTAAGKVALGEHGGSAGRTRVLGRRVVDHDERGAGAKCCGIGRARRVGDNSAIRRPRQADLAVAAKAIVDRRKRPRRGCGGNVLGLDDVPAISAFCQSSVVKALGRVRLTASAPSAVRTATSRPSSETTRIGQRAPRDDRQAEQRDRQCGKAQPGGRQGRQHQRDGQHDDGGDGNQSDRVERRQLPRTSSPTASIAVSPFPITQNAQPSRPNGISIMAIRANGMTITETNGMAARLAPRLSGETRWK